MHAMMKVQAENVRHFELSGLSLKDKGTIGIQDYPALPTKAQQFRNKKLGELGELAEQ